MQPGKQCNTIYPQFTQYLHLHQVGFFSGICMSNFFVLKNRIYIFFVLKKKNSLCYNQFSKKKLMAEFVDVKQLHGFMQGILMFGRCYKRLNLSMEFWTQSSFFKAYRLWTFIQYKSSYYVSSILSYLFVLRYKKAKTYQCSSVNPLWSLEHLETPPCILHLKTESLFKNRY